MKISVFSSKSYDIDYLKPEGDKYEFQLEFFEASLSKKTARLAHGSDAVCAFFNDKLDR